MKKRTARERWEALPGDTPAELIGEEIVLWSPGTAGHSAAITRLSRILGDPFEVGRGGPGGFWILVEPEVDFGPMVLIPDLAAWRRERLVLDRRARPIAVAPDWVCEVLSPSTVARDRTVKLATYAAAGVGHVWLVDPEASTLEALRLEGTRWIIQAVHAGHERVRVEPFQEIEIELGALWIP